MFPLQATNRGAMGKHTSIFFPSLFSCESLILCSTRLLYNLSAYSLREMPANRCDGSHLLLNIPQS